LIWRQNADHYFQGSKMATMNGNNSMSASSNMNAMIGDGTAIDAMGTTDVSAIQADCGDFEEIIHLDDDGTIDSDEIEVLDGEEIRKEKLIEIFCTRWKGSTITTRRELLTAIYTDGGMCFKHPFRTANQEKLDAFYKEVKAFGDLSKAKQGKQWTAVIVARQLYAFWSLVKSSDSFDDGGSRKRKSTEEKWLEEFRSLCYQAEQKLDIKEMGGDGSLSKNIDKYQQGKVRGAIDLSDIILKNIDPTCLVPDQHCPFCSQNGHKGVLLIVNREEMDKENKRLKDVKAGEVKKFNALSATEKSKRKRPGGMKSKGYIVQCICVKQHSKGWAAGGECFECAGKASSGAGNHVSTANPCKTCNCLCKAAFPIEKGYGILLHFEKEGRDKSNPSDGMRGKELPQQSGMLFLQFSTISTFSLLLIYTSVSTVNCQFLHA
jgi:hypothetical protein